MRKKAKNRTMFISACFFFKVCTTITSILLGYILPVRASLMTTMLSTLTYICKTSSQLNNLASTSCLIGFRKAVNTQTHFYVNFHQWLLTVERIKSYAKQYYTIKLAPAHRVYAFVLEIYNNACRIFTTSKICTK